MANKLFISPKGEAVYPHVTTPDTKFKKEGEFHTKVRVSPEDATEYAKAEALVKVIDAAAQKQLKESQEAETDSAKRKKIKLCEDMPYVIDEETQAITFNFKAKASGEKNGKKWTRKLALYDAKLQPLPETTKIGGGSVIKVSYAEPYTAFANSKVGVTVTLYMEGVQVIKLREWSRNGKSLGFAVEETEADDTPETEDGDPGPEAPSTDAETSADDF